jgi:hypothetical protein
MCGSPLGDDPQDGIRGVSCITTRLTGTTADEVQNNGLQVDGVLPVVEAIGFALRP